MTTSFQSDIGPRTSLAARTAAKSALPGTALFLLMSLVQLSPVAFGQALPAAEAAPISTGFTLPKAAGTLQYAVSASENLSTGYYSQSGVSTATSLNGDLAYISQSKIYPFSMVFTGGRSWSSSSQPSYTFLNLALSQVIGTKYWNFVLSDAVSYLPSTPSTGLSGVPGTGDLGLDPVQVGPDTGQGVLTNFSSRVNNVVTANAQRQLTGSTALHISGSYTLLRFLNNSSSSNGLDSDSETGSIGLSHRIDARNTLSGNYSYSNFTYNGPGLPSFSSQTASLQYTRQVTRKLNFSVSAGPQWTTIATAGSSASVNLFANVSAAYAAEFTHMSLAYTHSTNNGYGVIGGALSDSVIFTASRTFDRVWNCSASTSYTQTKSLPSAIGTPFSTDTAIAAGQVSRAIARSISVYGSYTLQNQSSSGAPGAVDLFTGLSNVASFGLTYSPNSIHLGRQ